MKRLVFFLVAASLVAPAGVAAQSDGQGAAPTIVVQGQGVVSRAPDTASLSVTIETIDPSATTAQAMNNAAYSRMLGALERVHVPRSSVHYSSYDFRYVPPTEPTPEPQAAGTVHTMPVLRNPRPLGRYGFDVTRSVSMSDLDPARVGAVVDACAGAGATSIDGVTFGVRDRTGAYDAALAAAVGDADRQARVLAEAGRLRLVRVQRIETAGGYVPSPLPMARMAAMADGTQIAPSNVETRASVTITYAVASSI